MQVFKGVDEENIGVDNGDKEQPHNGVFVEHKYEEKRCDGEEEEPSIPFVPPVCCREEGSIHILGPRLLGRRASFDIDAGPPRKRSVFGKRSITGGSRCQSEETYNSDIVDFYDYWTPPPVDDADDPNSPLRVDFRCACFKLTNISTVDFTTLIKFVVVFEWNDPRLKGISTTTNDLPGDLWGPDIILENALNDCKVVYDSFSLIDAASGRLKRTATFHGKVYNPMSLRE